MKWNPDSKGLDPNQKRAFGNWKPLFKTSMDERGWKWEGVERERDKKRDTQINRICKCQAAFWAMG